MLIWERGPQDLQCPVFQRQQAQANHVGYPEWWRGRSLLLLPLNSQTQLFYLLRPQYHITVLISVAQHVLKSSTLLLWPTISKPAPQLDCTFKKTFNTFRDLIPAAASYLLQSGILVHGNVMQDCLAVNHSVNPQWVVLAKDLQAKKANPYLEKEGIQSRGNTVGSLM